MDGPIQVSLRWQGEQRFDLQAGPHRGVIDGASEAGLTPMQLLAAGIAGCMSIDVTHILGRMRTPPDSVEVTLEAQRASADPRRFTGMHLRFRVTGQVPRRNVERALELSRNTYCSAWQSMRPDIELDTSVELNGGCSTQPPAAMRINWPQR